MHAHEETTHIKSVHIYIYIHIYTHMCVCVWSITDLKPLTPPPHHTKHQGSSPHLALVSGSFRADEKPLSPQSAGCCCALVLAQTPSSRGWTLPPWVSFWPGHDDQVLVSPVQPPAKHKDAGLALIKTGHGWTYNFHVSRRCFFLKHYSLLSTFVFLLAEANRYTLKHDELLTFQPSCVFCALFRGLTLHNC